MKINVVLIYELDGEVKVEYFESKSEMESAYNCLRKIFGERFNLDFAGSIRNKFEFHPVSKDREEVLV